MSQVSLRSVREVTAGPAQLLFIEYGYEPPGSAKAESPGPVTQTASRAVALAGWLKDPQDGAFSSDPEARLLEDRPICADSAARWVGEFALAEIAHSHIALVTDVYATRPIYYFFDGSRFVAANDLRLLFHCSLVPPELREEACLQYMGLSCMIGENEISDHQTFFRHIQKVPPATVLFLRDGRLTLRPYFSPADLLGRICYHRDFVAEFRSLLGEVTRDRVQAFRSTLHLSGGIDSSTLLAVIKDVGQLDRVSAVNMSFRDEDLVMSQDYQIARSLIEDLGVQGVILWGDDFLRIPNAGIDNDPLIYLDGPDPSANPLAKEAIAHVMLTAGAEQALTGESGDVILGEQTELLMLDSLIRSGRLRDLARVMEGWLHVDLQTALRNTICHVVSPFIPWLRDELYCRNFWQKRCMPPIPHYFSARVRDQERSTRQKYRQRYRMPSPHRLLGHRYMRDFLWPRAAYFDAMGTYLPHSHPFLDRRLLQFVFRSPTHIHCDYQSLHLGSYAATKTLARSAYQGVLPDYARLKRTKTSYAHMARKMLLNSRADLLSLFRDSLPATCELDLIDRDKLWNRLLATLLRAQDPGNDLGVSFHYLRGVIDLEIWLRNVRRPLAYLKQRSRPLRPRSLAAVDIV